LPVDPGNGHSPDGLIPVTDPRDHHVVPAPPQDKRRIVVGHIDPAMLMHRVEPVFPPILKQLHRSGKVELHALIAADGTIQSLQVVSGDPLCVESALDAVRQWRYRPTLLNGQPVEVDTFITVIYTTQQQ
jgi:protein TonB